MTQLPSLDLLRRLSDRAVLDQLLAHPELTRAEIAARTSLSKPTVSESMRRLDAAGLVAEAGQRTGGRGRAGVLYTLASDVGTVIAIDAGAEGVRAKLLDLRGGELATAGTPLSLPVEPDRLATALCEVVTSVLADATAPVITTSLSVADPVDRATGRVVQLPDSPFLVGDLDPRAVLGHLPLGELIIDNDVNWAALAELRSGTARGLDDALYCYLGAGIGAAVIAGGEIRGGHDGLAGELQQVITIGPGGQATRLVRCFAAWQLTRPGSAAIDVPRLRAVLDGGGPVADEVVHAVSTALASATALLNPQVIMLGGPWSDAGGLPRGIAAELTRAAVPAEVRAAEMPDAAYTGAGIDALARASAALLPD